MIHVARPKQAPAILTSALARKEQEAARKFFAPRRKKSAQQRFQFRLYRHPEVREAVTALFHGKCAYCEGFYGATQPLDVEHHRPKGRAMNLGGSVDADHYWWLASDWENVLAECTDCARSKRSRFPVQGKRAESPARGAALRKERALLLDPCADQPDRHLVFTQDGIVVPTSARGKATIEVLALNRSRLVSERADYYYRLQLWLRMAEELFRQLEHNPKSARLRDDARSQLEGIRRFLEPSQPFAAMHRQFINRWLDELSLDLAGLDERARPIVREVGRKAKLVTREEEREVVARFEQETEQAPDYSVEVEDREHKEAFYAGKKWVEWIDIKNFRAIEHMRLDFPLPWTDREPWLVILGENGTGKSSVLQAVALALMGEQHSAELGLDASEFVRRGARRGGGHVQVKLNNVPEPVEVRFRRSSTKFHYKSAPKVFLLGYGATRLLVAGDEPGEEAPTRIRIKNLFDPTARLADVEGWLMDRSAVDDDRFEVVAAALKDLLVLGPEETFVRTDDEVAAILNGQPPVPLRQLSDGFQSVVALAGDMIKSLLEGFPTMEEAEGIVLLDEIEAHLHPTWKIEIVGRLRRTFPSVAFLVSTHDPLCLKGLEQGEIVVLERDEERRIVPNTDVPPVNDLRADQILTRVLGLHSTRGDDAAARISRYAELFGKATRTADEQKELDQLATELDATMTKQETSEQLRIEAAITKTLAEEAAPVETKEKAGRAATPEELELRRQLDDLLGIPTG